MSLVTFIKNNADVRERFKQEFQKPRFQVHKELLAPPLTKHYSTVGTAFDYMLRFYLKRQNPDVLDTGHWIAEISLILLQKLPSVYLKAKKIVEQAKEREREFQKTGKITNALIESVLSLAYLDPIYRAGRGVEYIGRPIDPNDIEDVKQLLSIVRTETFTANNLCILNPMFGKASELVSGADADIVIDNNLIDIKTTKNLQFRMADFHQIMGYYVLSRIDGFGDLLPKPDIKKVSIYFSRHAYLHILDIRDFVDEDTFPDFVEWFIERAKEEYGTSNRRKSG